MLKKKKNSFSKTDSIYISHIKQAIDVIEKHLKGVTKNSFRKDIKTQDAVIRRIEIIGEATKRISKETREKYPSIPWREMAGMRDKLVHKYDDVELFILWETLAGDMPRLKKLLSKIPLML